MSITRSLTRSPFALHPTAAEHLETNIRPTDLVDTALLLVHNINEHTEVSVPVCHIAALNDQILARNL